MISYSTMLPCVKVVNVDGSHMAYKSSRISIEQSKNVIFYNQNTFI